VTGEYSREAVVGTEITTVKVSSTVVSRVGDHVSITVTTVTYVYCVGKYTTVSTTVSSVHTYSSATGDQVLTYVATVMTV